MSNNQNNNNEWQGEGSNNNNGGGPCGACKYRRRKCDEGCVFAPYFDSEQGTAHFEAVHKVFGASNVSRLLHRIPVHRRLDAVVSLCYEALSRVRDPVFGCVADITTLQQQVINMQAELAIVKAKLATLHSFTGANYTPNSCWVDEISSRTSTNNSNTLNYMPMAMFKNDDFGLYPPSPLVSSGAGAGAGAEAGGSGLSNFSNLTHNYQQDDMLVFEDGDLQTLTREYVSKFRNY